MNPSKSSDKLVTGNAIGIKSALKKGTAQRYTSKNSGGGSSRPGSKSPSRVSRGGSDYDNSSMQNVSAFDNDMQLSEKLQKYINRIAATCMGSLYAARYIRDWNRKCGKKTKRMLDMDADLAAQAELLGQIGFKSTLAKLRYSN